MRKKEKYSSDDLDDAHFLIEAARIHAISLHAALLKTDPEFVNVAKSGLIEFWELIVTAASVGLAFSEIIDTVPKSKQEGLSYAIQKALNDYHEIAYSSMVDFLNHFKKGMDSGIEIPLALGGWVWANLAKDEKANSKLKKLLHSEKIPLSIGYPILEAFHSWWLKKSKPDGTYQYNDDQGKVHEGWMPPEIIEKLLKGSGAKKLTRVLIKGPWEGIKEDYWDVEDASVKKFADDEGTVYAMCHFENGEPQYHYLGKRMWLNVEKIEEIVMNPRLSEEEKKKRVDKLK